MGDFASPCLAELDLGDRCLDGVLSNNHYESDVLKVTDGPPRQAWGDSGQVRPPEVCSSANGSSWYCC